jgi:hypothetical protein
MLFRNQKNQGFFESLAALALQYQLSSYSHDWTLFYNSMAIHFVCACYAYKIIENRAVIAALFFLCLAVS